MELSFILANIGYFFAVIALATKDILWLRSILLIGQVCIVAYLLMIKDGIMDYGVWISKR